MTLGELINLARLRLDDLVAPYQWSDAALIEFANSAQDEACIRARILRDVAVIDATSAAGTYAFPFQILNVLDATVTDANGSQRLWQISNAEYQRLLHYDMSTFNRPRQFTVSPDAASFTLFPTPQIETTVEFVCARAPLESERMTSFGDSPVIPTQFHRDLVYWMLYQAFSMRDADKQSLQLATQAEKDFIQRFGNKPSARMEQLGRTSGVGRATYPVFMGFPQS